MKLVNLSVVFAALTFGSVTFADNCPVNMKVDKLIDCIVQYGASDQYKESIVETEKRASAKKIPNVAIRQSK